MTHMLLHISHTTTYDYDQPVTYALQQLRLTPKSTGAQTIREWSTTVEGGKKQLSFEDAHRNTVDLISFDAGTRRITVRCEGTVELRPTNGVIGQHGGFMPLWMFDRTTALTKPGAGCQKLLKTIDPGLGPVPWLHALSAAIEATVAYKPGLSNVGWSAEDALSAGHGVCQDHAHVFIASARAAGYPARYVSGYLLMDDDTQGEATHAWAEAYVPELGWVGFDISNGISPDQRYVRVATGLDYAGAAPVSGMRLGVGAEQLTVAVQVQQQ